MKNSIFSNRKTAPFWAFFCAAGWSLAYPLIKLGYAQLHIASDDLGSKIGFAGIRFLVAGILVTILAIIQKRKFKVEQKSVVAWLLLFALVNTALHYLFSYVGLGYLPSSRSTILDSMNGFFAIILSCIILGFSGILLINIEPGQNFFQGISFRGDGMILLNAMCGAFGGIITRIISKKMDMTVATSLSMTIGGTFLCVVSAIIGPAARWTITTESIIIMIGLILISAVCFGVYNQLLAYHPISKIAIFNAFIPILGVIFSSIILGEPMRVKYIIAGCIVALGVYVMNHFSK